MDCAGFQGVESVVAALFYIFVPLCRTKIWPALAACPSEIFIPRYFGRESLPKVEDPADLVLAINLRYQKSGGLSKD